MLANMKSAGHILLIILLGGVSACSEEATEVSQSPRPITWTKATPVPVQRSRQLPGHLEAVQTATLSFALGGTITDMTAKFGDKVRKGQNLARLDTNDLSLKLKQRQSEVAAAKATLHEARLALERQEKLAKGGWASEQTLEKLKANHDSAQAQLDIAFANAALAQSDLTDSVISAPFDGIITARYTEPEQQVAAGGAVFEIEGSAEGFEIIVDVPESLVWDVIKKQKTVAILPARDDKELSVILTRLNSRSERSGTFEAAFSLQSDLADLRSGMSAEVSIKLAKSGPSSNPDAVSLPVTALSTGAGDKYDVFLFEQTIPEKSGALDGTSGLLKRQAVSLVEITASNAIVSGLQAGAIIATSGVSFLQNGMPATLLDTHTLRYNE